MKKEERLQKNLSSLNKIKFESPERKRVLDPIQDMLNEESPQVNKSIIGVWKALGPLDARKILE
jgi:hypothetical protein